MKRLVALTVVVVSLQTRADFDTCLRSDGDVATVKEARFTGTEPEFWLNLQQAVDLWETLHSHQTAELKDIGPAQVA